MVVLIGGSSHVGKTMVARKLVERHGWECGFKIQARGYGIDGLEAYSLSSFLSF